MTGAFLSWASIVDTFVYEWGDFSPTDRWITVLSELLDADPVFPTPEIEARVAAGMFNILIWRQPRHPDLPAWEKKVMRIASRQQLRLFSFA